MLMIQAVANTMIALVFIAGAMLGMRTVLRAVADKQFAKIAESEAIDLDRQFREMLD